MIIQTERKNNKWEEKTSDISIDDIDEETLIKFVEKGNKRGRINYEYTNKEDILKRLNLIGKNGKIKNAGNVLFGKNPNVDLRCAIFATEEKSTFLDMQDYSGNIFKLIDIGEQYISKNIRWSANFNTGSFAREDLPEIPMTAIREALCNSSLPFVRFHLIIGQLLRWLPRSVSTRRSKRPWRKIQPSTASK